MSYFAYLGKKTFLAFWRHLNKFLSKGGAFDSALKLSSCHSKEALLSYIVAPFSQRYSFSRFISHQNWRESLEIANILDDLGYNVTVAEFSKNLTLSDSFFDLVIGFYDPFDNAQLNNGGRKIFYATGAYWKYQNEMIRKRTEEVNKLRNSSLELKRCVKNNDYSLDTSELVLQIGSSFTISTYPEVYRNKIKLIKQSSFEFLHSYLGAKDYVGTRRNFLWFGSSGAILKGLDLVLEYIIANKNLTLHVVGAPEMQFVREYRKELFECKNVTFHGWLPLNSRKLLSIAEKCSFVILPSASEGCPGSVINMIKLGLIPIVSEAASFDNLPSFGYVIPMSCLNSFGLSMIVENALMETPQNNKKRSREGQLYVMKNFSISTFNNDIREALS